MGDRNGNHQEVSGQIQRPNPEEGLSLHQQIICQSYRRQEMGNDQKKAPPKRGFL